LSSEQKSPPSFLQKYCVSLTEKIDIFQKHIDEESILLNNKEEILQSLHKIIGSGGMYGFDELSQKAVVCHEKVSDFAKHSQDSQDDIVKEIAELISIMKNIVSKHSG